MAKFYSTTFGKMSGKIGDVVAVITKDGKNYIRTHKKNKYDPKTPKQLEHRARISITSKALGPFNPLFKEILGTTNGISIGRSHAFKNAIVGEYPDFLMDYEKLMFSFGSLNILDNATVAFGESVITVSWDILDVVHSSDDDTVSFIVFNKETSQVLYLQNVAYRSDKRAELEVHESWAEASLYCWAYATNGEEFSDSEFVGVG